MTMFDPRPIPTDLSDEQVAMRSVRSLVARVADQLSHPGKYPERLPEPLPVQQWYDKPKNKSKWQLRKEEMNRPKNRQELWDMYVEDKRKVDKIKREHAEYRRKH